MTNPTDKIVVAQIVQNLDVGGLERVVINLLLHGNHERFAPILITLGNGGALADEVRDRGIPVLTMNKGTGRFIGLPWQLAGVMREHRVSVVHAHNHSPLLYGALAARLAGVSRVVFTSHGIKTSSRPLAARLRRMGMLHDMVYVSDDSRDHAVTSGGVSPEDARVIINGIDIGRYAAPDEREMSQIRSQLGLGPETRVYGIVARLNEAKDHPNLLRAFAQLHERMGNAHLLVIGDGETREEVEQVRAELGLEQSVTLMGNRKDIPQLLGVIDVFVLSSRREGMAMTLLEAMAAGRPIVATRVGGNPEVVAEDETGLIVAPESVEALAEGMWRLGSDPDMMARMGAAARERVAEYFSVAAMCDRYEALYQS